MSIYLAGPLFTEAERAWHKAAKAQMEQKGWRVVWPGDLLDARAIEAAGADAPGMIFAGVSRNAGKMPYGDCASGRLAGR
jgi:nucleoside 2-deoxyribosyltransferase